MATKKLRVLHHQPGRPAKEFVLIKKHGSKTADFADEDGTVVCEGCPIGPQEDATRSYCTIVEDDDADEKPSKKTADEAAKKAAEEAAKKAAEEAAKKAAEEAAKKAAEEAAKKAAEEAAKKASDEGSLIPQPPPSK